MGKTTPFCARCGVRLPDTSTPDCADCGATQPISGWPVDTRLGETIVADQYRVVRRLGAGGFGVVYEVQTVVGGLRRAIKVLDSRWAADSAIRERFVNEALVLEQVNHPSVARCFAVGELEDGSMYLLLELIEGVSLHTMLEQEKRPLSPLRAARMAKHIAAGLVAAHANSVLHRDLKPENILVVAAGTSDERIKVVDFGIAKLTDDGATSTQTIVGTPEFMAPEQFAPGTQLDHRVDLWQLGATMFTMLTGDPPYRPSGSGGILSILAQQGEREGAGPSPSERVPALAEIPALDTLVSRLLTTDAELRPSSAADVVHELARIEHQLSGPTIVISAAGFLESLCAEPSEAGWWALARYILSMPSADHEELVTEADLALVHWPDELRPAACGWWEHVRSGRQYPLWPLVRSLDLSGHGLTDADISAATSTRALARVRHLHLANNQIGEAGAGALAQCPHLAGVERLNLNGNRIGPRGFETLVTSARLVRLRALEVAGNGIGVAGVRALARTPGSLEVLDLSDNELGAAGVAALASADAIGSLRELRLARNAIGPDGAAALANARPLTGLRVLDLLHNDIGASGAAALAESPVLRSVESLTLAQNHIGANGLAALAGSSGLLALRELDVASNEVGAAGAMTLAGSALARRLERLGLADNELGDAGLATLLGARSLAGLRALDAAQNGLTGASVALIGAAAQLRELDVSRNPLGAEGAAALADALAHARVRSLEIAKCNLTDDVLASLVSRVELSVLGASSNQLGVQGVTRLAACEHLRTIERLDLSGCGIGELGLAALVQSSHLGRLRRLLLDTNAIGDNGVRTLARHGDRMQRLMELSLAGNELSATAAAALADAPLATRLGRLDLSFNELGDAGAEALAQGASWRALRALAVAHNDISLSGAAALVTSTGMETLHQLDLTDNALAGGIDLHSLGAERIDLLEDSFGALSVLGTELARRFYAELFARYPSVKPLFAHVSMARQQQHLMSALLMVIDNLRNPDVLEASLLALGERHLDYGVFPSHYYAVTSTLLDVIAAAAGDRWSPELEAAWSNGLDAIRNVMMRAHVSTNTGSQTRQLG